MQLKEVQNFCKHKYYGNYGRNSVMMNNLIKTIYDNEINRFYIDTDMFNTIDALSKHNLVEKINKNIARLELNAKYGINKGNMYTLPTIKNVIFNKPATIVQWTNGDKTVVKCQEGDEYSKEAGLAIAIVKYIMGNKGNYNNIFKKWCK